MSIRESLSDAIRLAADGDVLGWIHGRGLAVADEDTMTRAIHEVTCGTATDHDAPNAADRAQARAMVAALQRQVVDSAR